MPGVCGAVEEEDDGAEEGVGEGGRREEAEAAAVLGQRRQHEGAEHQWQDEQQAPANRTIHMNRVTRLLGILGNNLPLTWFRQFRQLVGCYYSCLLPRQNGGTSHIKVNRTLSQDLMTNPVLRHSNLDMS